MSFLDPYFYLGLAIVVALYWALPWRARMPLLLLASALWLGYASPFTLAVFTGIATLGYIGCVWIVRAPDDPGRKRRRWTSSTVLVALAVAARVFFTDIFGGLTLSTHQGIDEAFKLLGFAYVVLKVHHSFVIAKADGTIPANPQRYLHYLIYIPTLSAGPLLRLREWHPLHEKDNAHFDAAHFEAGLKRILWGLFKKLVIVVLLLKFYDHLDNYSRWYINPSLMAIGLLTIYFDFSGYSDIAIGVGRLFGHRLPENFKSPFLATSLSHFWRKWHISMGDWIREHIFIPLGGMRAKGAKLYALLFGSMMFCGLWHAFELRFVLWGVYHGVLLAAEQLLGIHPLPPNAPWYQTLPRRIVIFLVMIGSAAFFIPSFW